MAELQRRGVIRAGVTYVMLSLILILLEPYVKLWMDLPHWSTTVLLAFLLLAFPIAMYLAWNYENSPDGFVRTTSKESWQNPLKDNQRKPFTGNSIIAGLLVVLIGVIIYPRLTSSKVENTEAVQIDDKTIASLYIPKYRNTLALSIGTRFSFGKGTIAIVFKASSC